MTYLNSRKNILANLMKSCVKRFSSTWDPFRLSCSISPRESKKCTVDVDLKKSGDVDLPVCWYLHGIADLITQASILSKVHEA